MTPTSAKSPGCIGGILASVNGLAKGFRVGTKGFCKPGEWDHAPVVFTLRGVAPVVDLDAPRSPSAVPFGVGAVVVDSVYGQAFRPRTHVGIEAVEILAPLVADSDSAPPISGEVLGVRVVATGLHGLPCGVLGSLLERLPVPPESFPRQISSQTAATLALATANPGYGCNNFSSAVATKQPSTVTARDGNKPSEPLSGNISWWVGHGSDHSIARLHSAAGFGDAL